MKKKKTNLVKEPSATYEPLVKTELSFDQLLKLSANTPLPKNRKIMGSRSKKKRK